MNKNILKALFCSALVAPAFTSCELDQFPETNITDEVSWQTVSDATAYDVGLNAVLRGATEGSVGVLKDVQADLFNLTGKAIDFYDVNNWTFNSDGFSGDYVWKGYYNMIANANNIINNIDKIQVKEESADEKLLKNYKSHAYFARAYAYAELALRYCKDYEPETAETTLGLPLCFEVDVNLKPGRATLAETYKQICEDIKMAKDLSANPEDMDYTVPNYNVIEALEARVSLAMHDYDTAIASAKDLIAKYPLISDEYEFADMWFMDDGSEIIYQPVQNRDERIGSFSSFVSYDASAQMNRPAYIPTQGLYDLYEDDDIRKGVFFANGATAGEGLIDDDVITIAKFPGNTDLCDKGMEGQQFFNMTKVFRVAEMYLIAAEAQYRKDGTGVDFLNQLRASRNASELNMTGLPLFQAIQNEWAREMCGEGFRLDCFKRWHLGFKRMKAQELPAGFLRTADEFINLKVEADNFRFVWEIPSNDLTNNPNLNGQHNWPEE